jgi:ABC-type multidrug transport system fused ATPase/permease subunit
MSSSSSDIHQIIMKFADKRRTWVGTNFLLMIVHFPLELIALSYLSGKIFTMMSNMKMNYRRVVQLTIYFFFIYFLIELSIVVRDVYDSCIVPHLEREIRNHVITLIMEKNEIQFDQLEMGEIVVRFLKTPAYSLYSYVVLTKFIIPFIASLIFLGIYITWLNRKVGFLYFLLFSIYSMVMTHFSKEMMEMTKKKMTQEMDMFNKIEDTLSNMQTIYTSNTVEKEKQRMDEEQKKYIRVHQQEMRMNTQIKLGLSSYCLCAIVFLFLLSVHLYRKKEISQETLISLMTLFLFMCRFLGYTSRKIVEGMITIGSFVDSNQFINKLYVDTFQDGTVADFIDRGEICFEKVCFRYNHSSPYIFQDLDIVVPPRSRIVLMGDSGSGKTTFLRLILGFYRIEKGDVRIDTVDVSKSRRGYLRNKIAYINQNTRLFDRSILENILYGSHDHDRKDVEAFIQENNLSGMFNKTSHGLDTKAGKGGEKLSGGMRQIILLMRCVFKDCPIVILDECTSSIDVKHRQYAIVIIKRLFHSKTVICVSHDPDIIQLFDQKLVFGNNQKPALQKIEEFIK